MSSVFVPSSHVGKSWTAFAYCCCFACTCLTSRKVLGDVGVEDETLADSRDMDGFERPIETPLLNPENRDNEFELVDENASPWHDAEVPIKQSPVQDFSEDDLPTTGGHVGASDSEVDDCMTFTRSLQQVALSEEHQRTHFPALPDHCEVCRRAKRQQRRKLQKNE